MPCVPKKLRDACLLFAKKVHSDCWLLIPFCWFCWKFLAIISKYWPIFWANKGFCSYEINFPPKQFLYEKPKFSRLCINFPTSFFKIEYRERENHVAPAKIPHLFTFPLKCRAGRVLMVMVRNVSSRESRSLDSRLETDEQSLGMFM